MGGWLYLHNALEKYINDRLIWPQNTNELMLHRNIFLTSTGIRPQYMEFPF